ncbi:hypothetical protein HYV91_03810 [Candidatus Wolfebacteria bacterium]|nr:hypothetical protein [Candidatus Wolfebacteria bacterium]
MGRYLGQHFLVGKNKLRKIVEALELRSGDTVVEIGSGHGELTKEIVQLFDRLDVRRFKIIAIEKDRRLVQALLRVVVDKRVEVVEGDALAEIKNQLIESDSRGSAQMRGGLTRIQRAKIKTKDKKLNILKNLKLVGNIPYYITGQLLRIIGESENKPSLVVLTIQKEVAERLCALRQAQGKPGMNLLSASVQFWAKPEIIGYISKKYFRPRPKVDSAIIRLRTTDYRLQQNNNSGSLWSVDGSQYFNFIKILFKQPRKTILNNLLRLPTDYGLQTTAKKEKIVKELQKIGINPNDRPQNLSIDQLFKLTSIF